MRLASVAILAALLGTACSAAAKSSALRLTLSRPESGQGAPLLLSVENPGPDDVVVKLGDMLANGQRQLPGALRLFRRRAGRTEELGLFEPLGGIGGRLDDYVVPLRADSSYTLRLSPSRIWAAGAAADRPGITLAAGDRLWAELEAVRPENVNGDMKGVALMPFWTGKARSNTLEIPGPRGR